ERDVKIIFNPDIPGDKAIDAVIAVVIVPFVIDAPDARPKAGIPVEAAVNVPHPLVEPGQLKGVEIIVVAKPQVKFQSGRVAADPPLVRNFGADPVSAAKAQADGVL